MRSDTMIRKEGLEALKSRLDPVEMEKFLMLVRRDNFDYTEWQRGLWENETVAGIFAKGRSLEKSPQTDSRSSETKAGSAEAKDQRMQCHCTDASIAPVIAIKRAGQKWQLFGISEVHGMGSASHDKNLFAEEYDEIVPLNSMRGVSYILYRQGSKWGIIQIKDNRRIECAITKLKAASFASEAALLKAMHIDRKKFTSPRPK